MAPNFGAILDKQPTEVDRPKPLPVGSYIWLIKGLPKMDKSARKGTEFVEFNLSCLSALDDVDEDELAKSLTKASGEKVKLTDKTQRATFYITEDALYRLKDFLGHCGFDMDEDDKTIRQIINETPGCQVGASIKHVASEDGEMVYANIGKTFKPE